MTISATSEIEPCVDEIQCLSADSAPRNVALASLGAKPTASGTLPNVDIHRLEHINDGQVGNDRSWISNEIGRGWVQIEFAQTELIDTILWGRDQSDEPKFVDRVPTDYVFEASVDGATWTRIASSRDRLPRGTPGKLEGLILTYAHPDQRDAVSGLADRWAMLRKTQRELAGDTFVYAGRMREPAPTKRFHRGDPTQPREDVAPAALSEIGPKIELPADTRDLDRRRKLADWIASPTNPLTARVIVNRLWQQHFGEGIVATPSDLGTSSPKPSHPELLDSLALELVDHGWLLKPVHRAIVESSAYRQSSRSQAEGAERDASSRLLWRYPPRRLEAEPLRDAILAASGNLDLAMGGPGFDLFETNTNYVKVYVSKSSFGPAEWRRMVYQSKPRMQLDHTFGVFDCPDAGQIAPKRGRSTTPLQALALLNSGFMVEQARIFADRLRHEAGPEPADQVRHAFQILFHRPTAPEELSASVELISQTDLETFCRALFNTNEWLTVF
jgi:hypothetical protein